MTITWEVTYTEDFSEEIINILVEHAREEGWDEKRIIEAVRDEVEGFEDDVYYAWGPDQTREVVNEILRRLGGVQLSMFED